jgi:hypothetical protein
VRPLDLDRDDVAVVEAGPVDLPDRRRGERLVLEGREGDLGSAPSSRRMISRTSS